MKYIPLKEAYIRISSELSNNEIIDYLIELGYLLDNGKPADKHLASGLFSYEKGEDWQDLLVIDSDEIRYISSQIYKLRNK